MRRLLSVFTTPCLVLALAAPANEDAGRTDFANVPSDAHFQMLEGAGASDINGTTDFDRTNCFETLPSNQLELALWLESDRTGYLLDVLDQADLEPARAARLHLRRRLGVPVPALGGAVLRRDGRADRRDRRLGVGDLQGDQPHGRGAAHGRRAGAGARLAHAFAARAVRDVGPGHLGLDYFVKYPQQVGAVTADVVQDVAKRHLVPGRMVVVAVGDRAKIAPQMGKLSLGTTELRDTDGNVKK